MVNENKELKREICKLKEEKKASDRAFEEIATNNMNAIGDTLEPLAKEEIFNDSRIMFRV